MFRVLSNIRPQVVSRCSGLFNKPGVWTRPSVRFYRKDQYNRFKSAETQSVFKSEKFWYVTGALGVGIFAYYQYHTESVPITGRKRFITITPQEEIEIGNQSIRMLMRKYRSKILPQNHPSTKLVRKVSEKIIKAAGMTDMDWEFYVINASTVNAFVSPGGKVFVFAGLLPVAENEDGLATVLSHEIAHQFARHTDIFSALFAKFALELPHSRSCESEADHLGLLFMSQACFNPNEAVRFWERMDRAAGSGSLEFLSTHPSGATRIDNIRSWLPEAELRREAAGCIQANQFIDTFRHKDWARW